VGQHQPEEPAMTLEPLYNAPHLAQLHAFCATGAIVLGAVQIFAPKGTINHRTFGWTWVVLMVGMAATAFMNHPLVTWNPFSPDVCCRASDGCSRGTATCGSIHVMTLYILLCLPYAALHARFSVKHHRRAMIGLFIVMLGGAAVQLFPHRTLNHIVFGPSEKAQDQFAGTPRQIAEAH
jgi:uncharacterized membrane protein